MVPAVNQKADFQFTIFDRLSTQIKTISYILKFSAKSFLEFLSQIQVIRGCCRILKKDSWMEFTTYTQLL